MLLNFIGFRNTKIKKQNSKIFLLLKKLLKENNEIINSLKNDYKNSYDKKIIKKYKRINEIVLIGMGGSIMGSRAIYSFLKKNIKKIFYFKDTFEVNKFKLKKKSLNLIISKSGNTLETISNSNFLINRKVNNIFITQNKESYLMNLAKKLKSEIIHHNNFIGGRYSVLSEVGMLPAELMGLKTDKFKRLNFLVKDRNFINSLVQNVSSTLFLIKEKKYNSIILNYDEKAVDLFLWYQQLMAESLGKKGKGILPIISQMPKDNHSLMQSYLDGPKNNFYTFFFTHDKSKKKIRNSNLLKSHSYLKNKSLEEIKKSQYMATKKVFNDKKIPFRSFYLKKRNEEILGEIFVFFILETILLGKALGVNPYDQPSVELIKTETKKFLIKS